MPSPDPATQYQLFVGVDIAAAPATGAWQRPQQKPSKPLTLEQTPEGFALLHQRLISTGARPEQILVVMEATGIYWLACATYFARQGYAISVVNPSQAHHFAKALLKRAKTDAIDAHTLTQLAALLQPALWTPPPSIYEELEQRLSQRESLLLMRGQLRNQRHALTHTPVVVTQVRHRMEALEQTLSAQVADIEAELAALVRAEEEQTATGTREGRGHCRASLGQEHCSPANDPGRWTAQRPVDRRDDDELHALCVSRTGSSLCWAGSHAARIGNQCLQTSLHRP